MKQINSFLDQRGTTVVYALLAFFILVSVCSVGYIIYSTVQDTTVTPAPTMVDLGTLPLEEVLPPVVEETSYEFFEDELGTYTLQERSSLTFTSYVDDAYPVVTSTVKIYDNTSLSFEIDWITEEKTPLNTSDVSVFEPINALLEAYPDYWDTLYGYQAGTIVSPGMYQGETIYLLFQMVEGLGLQAKRMYVLFPDGFDNKPVELTDRTVDRELAWYGEVIGLLPSTVYTNISLTPSDEFKLFDIPGQMDRLIQRGYFVEGSGFNGRIPFDNVLGLTDVVSGTYRGLPSDGNRVILGSETFVYKEGLYYKQFSDGRIAIFERTPGFSIQAPDEAGKEMYGNYYIMDQVTFADPSWNDRRFYFAGTESTAGGCGYRSLPGTSIISTEPWFKESDMTPVGYIDGTPRVYTVKQELRREHPYYRQFFEDVASMGRIPYDERETEKIFSLPYYTEYLNNEPLVFWKSNLGDWHAYMNAAEMPAVECGKPVIYLYPEQTTDVRVEVSPNGGFTEVDPDYPDGGWVVRAEPNGSLYNYANSTVYPYLFWEGHANGFGYSDNGWIFASDTLTKELSALLRDVGLNVQETADFVEYWVPRMTDAPYVFVTFANQADFERAAPLRVTPAPDSTFRLFMYFEPRDTFEVIEPLLYRPFVRRGFSVVEWGGVLAGDKK